MNNVSLLGRLTKDTELRYTQSNTAVCSFTLAVDRRFKSEGQPTADFINCQAWGKTAEFVSTYFEKGSMIGAIGRIQTRNYEDRDGKKVYVTEVVVESCYFAGSKSQQNHETHSNDAEPVDILPEDQLPF